MNPNDKFPIESLSEERWQRIEQRLFAPAAIARRAAAFGSRADPERSPPRAWPMALAGAALMVAGAWGMQQPWRADPEAAAPRRVIAADTALETSLGDASLRLEPGAEALLTEQASTGALVVLARGEARFSVPPRAQRAPFAVQAGPVRVEVVGTRFRVSRDGERVRVVDDEGRVRVRLGQQTKLLAPGESWSNEPSFARARTRALRPAPSQPAPQPASAAAQAAPSPTDPEASDLTRPAPLAKRPAGATRANGQRGAQGAPGEEPRERFEQAARLEASDPQQALQIYGIMATAGGAWAETALYAMGRLSLEQGDRTRAIPLLHGYLRRYPHGANAEDVRGLLTQLGVPLDEETR